MTSLSVFNNNKNTIALGVVSNIQDSRGFLDDSPCDDSTKRGGENPGNDQQ